MDNIGACLVGRMFREAAAVCISVLAARLHCSMMIFCVVPIQDDRGGQWRVQAVSVAPASFQNRKSLPKGWQGLRDEQLSEAAGIPDCVFVHASGASSAALTMHALL